MQNIAKILIGTASHPTLCAVSFTESVENVSSKNINIIKRFLHVSSCK